MYMYIDIGKFRQFSPKTRQHKPFVSKPRVQFVQRYESHTQVKVIYKHEGSVYFFNRMIRSNFVLFSFSLHFPFYAIPTPPFFSPPRPFSLSNHSILYGETF